MAATQDLLKVKQEPIEVLDDNDEEDDLEALRMAALQTIRTKTQSPPQPVPVVNEVPVFHHPRPPAPPKLVQTAIYRQHQANPNLIAIVPVNTPIPEPTLQPVPHTHTISTHQRSPAKIQKTQPLPLPQNRYCSSLDSTPEDKTKEVPTKFSRIDASDSESDDDILLKRKGSSDEEDDDDDDDDGNSGANTADNDNDGGNQSDNEGNQVADNRNYEVSGGFASLEDDDSLEKLMEVMEQEFSQGTKKVTKNVKKKAVKINEEKVKVKIKKEKVEDKTERNNVFENIEEPKIHIKTEVIEDNSVESVVYFEKFEGKQKICDSKTIIEPVVQNEDHVLFDSALNSVSKENENIDCLKKKTQLDRVNSTAVASPIRIRSPREVNLKFLQNQVSPEDVNSSCTEKYVYTNIINETSQSSVGNDDCFTKSSVTQNENSLPPANRPCDSPGHVRKDRSLTPIDYRKPEVNKIVDNKSPRRNINEVGPYRRSLSPRRRIGELSPNRRSLSPRSKNFSPQRYLSPRRSRALSPRDRSFSPRRRRRSIDFSPRRSLSPRRRSRSPLRYSASPSPVRRWRSNSRSPLSRSRSRSWTRSYSRSRSRSRSPYYRYRSPSPLRRSLSRSPRPMGKHLPTRYLPEKKLLPPRSPLSPRKRDYSPLRRGFSPFRDRKKSISPRRSRSPSFSYRRFSPSFGPSSPKHKRYSPSPPRLRKKSMSPRRRLSPARSARFSASPRRSPVSYNSFSPKRGRSSISPVSRQRQISLSPRRRISPIRTARISISPRRQSPFSPRRTSPRLKRKSISPRRPVNSPLIQSGRKSLTPPRRYVSPRKKSLSPFPRQLGASRLSPVRSKQVSREPYIVENRQRKLSISPRRLSPFSRRPVSPWKNSAPVQDSKCSSVSPERVSYDPKVRKVSVSPKRNTELSAKQHSLSPKRSPKRRSPRRNVQSPSLLRKSCSPSNKSPQRKSSPLVVRQRRNVDNRRLPPQSREVVQPARPVGHQTTVQRQTRSPSLSPSPVKDVVIERNRPLYVGNKEGMNKKRGGSPQDYYSHHRYSQRRRRNFGERNKERDAPRRERVRDRDRVRDVKDRDKVREKVRGTTNQTQKEREKEKPKSKVEEKKIEEKLDDKNVINDPVLEARRRKFESNSPIQPANKKIRLKTKMVAKESVSSGPLNVSMEDKLSETEHQPSLSSKHNADKRIEIEQPTSITRIEPNKVSEVEKPLRIMRTESNKSLDKACNTDDVLDLGDDELLMDYDDLLEEEQEQERNQARVEQKKVVTLVKEERRMESKKKELKQAKVKPLTRNTASVDKACSPLFLPKKDDVTDEEKIPEKEQKIEASKEKEECDLRAELSRRRAERLTKAGSVHESLPKRLLQSAFIGLMGGKSRLDSKEKKRKSSSSQLQSQVHVQPPPPLTQALRKERPVEGKRRVLLLNRSSTHKTAVQISFPKVVPGTTDSQSDSDSDDDDDDEDNDDVDEEEEEKSDEQDDEEESNIVLKERRRDRKRLRRLPIHLRLGVMTGHCSRRKVKMRHRNQVGRLPSIALDLHDTPPGREIAVDVTTIVKKPKKKYFLDIH